MCVCMYVCMCVGIYVCMYLCMYVSLLAVFSYKTKHSVKSIWLQTNTEGITEEETNQYIERGIEGIQR